MYVLGQEVRKRTGDLLVTQFLHDPNVTRKLVPEPLEVDGKKYQIQFRFKNSVKQYLITLDNVQRENYSGSMTPRDFSSDVRIMDESEGSEQKGHIWMNNPMRFRGNRSIKVRMDRPSNRESAKSRRLCRW